MFSDPYQKQIVKAVYFRPEDLDANCQGDLTSRQLRLLTEDWQSVRWLIFVAWACVGIWVLLGIYVDSNWLAMSVILGLISFGLTSEYRRSFKRLPYQMVYYKTVHYRWLARRDYGVFYNPLRLHLRQPELHEAYRIYFVRQRTLPGYRVLSMEPETDPGFLQYKQKRS
jgi:hypothetical protein